jgi:hypothetical protein
MLLSQVLLGVADCIMCIQDSVFSSKWVICCSSATCGLFLPVLEVDQNHIFAWRENVSLQGSLGQLVLFVQDLQEDNILRALGHPQLQRQQLLQARRDCGGLQSCMRNLWLQ